MLENVQDIVIKFEKEGIKTTKFIDALSDELFDTRLYEDGDQWTIRQTCIHIVDSERATIRLLQNVIEGGEGVPIDFDLDRYNASRIKKVGFLDKSEIVSRITSHRADTVRIISEFAESDLDIIGRHPFIGESTIRDMLGIMLINVSSHLRDIQNKL